MTFGIIQASNNIGQSKYKILSNWLQDFIVENYEGFIFSEQKYFYKIYLYYFVNTFKRKE